MKTPDAQRRATYANGFVSGRVSSFPREKKAYRSRKTWRGDKVTVIFGLAFPAPDSIWLLITGNRQAVCAPGVETEDSTVMCSPLKSGLKVCLKYLINCGI